MERCICRSHCLTIIVEMRKVKLCDTQRTNGILQSESTKAEFFVLQVGGRMGAVCIPGIATLTGSAPVTRPVSVKNKK